MCGLAGVIAWDDQYRVSTGALRKMAAAIAHRGPDGEGIFLNHEGVATPDHPQAGFAFRRLAILDPDPRSDQPFTDGRRTMVFNGEIYNFRELRAELSKDHDFKTTGDTEVVLAAYAAWGEKCVERFNGMFALAVWDEAEKTLFLARDRMGQKPLYWAAPVWPRYPVMAFASEIGSLRTLDWFSTETDDYSIAEYLRYGYVEGHVPVLASCLSFGLGWNTFRWNKSAGAAMSLDGRPYFDPNEPRNKAADGIGGATPSDGSPPMPSAALLKVTTRDLVRQAVRRQLVSDVPLGVFLSGGIDSSVIAASARREGPVQTFSIGFDDRRYDETEYAAAVARHLGTDHHEFRVTPDAVADLPKLAAVFGVPFGDSSALPTHYLSRETRRHVKVALSGDGGDELFGGYDRYRAMRWGERLKPLAIGPVTAVGRSASRGHPKSAVTRAGRLLASLAGSEVERYDSYVRLFDEPTLKSLWPEAPRHDGYWTVPTQWQRLRDGRGVVETALAVDRVTYLPGDLLTKVDRCSMLHGLEVRSPFMDHELVQFAAGLTADQLLKGGPKRMLREAFAADLPAWVFKRKKMGFAVPIGDWFRGPLRSMLTDTLLASDAFGRSHFEMKVVQRLMDEHQSGRVDHSQRLYALLMLELWWRRAQPV